MKRAVFLLPLLFAALVVLLLWHPWRGEPPPPSAPKITAEEDPAPARSIEPQSPYTLAEASRDGTGKFYLGREIAQIMGHEGIDWLERDNREDEEAPSKAIAAIDLPPTAVIADIGAGSGYYSFRLAKNVVPQGEVIAVDIQPEMIEHLTARTEQEGVSNVRPHLGSIESAELDPESIDAALFVDAYHEFSHPYEMMKSIFSALRSGGRVFLLEYRAEDPEVPIRPLHKMTEAQAVKEMQAVGFEHLTTHDFLPWQHFMVFRKPD